MRILLASFILLSGIELYAQLPSYYFNIKEIYTSPYIVQETEEGHVNYRLLVTQRGETKTLIVERFKLSTDRGKPHSLLNHYLLWEDDFDIYTFKKVNLVNWKATDCFDISLNEGTCYSVQLGKTEGDVVVKRCD